MAAGLAAYPMAGAGRFAPLFAVLAVAGLLCVLLAGLAHGRFTGAAVFTLATEYALAEATGHVPAVSVIGYAAGLIIVSELLLWAGQLPSAASADRAVATGQLMILAVIMVAGAVLALAVLAAAGLRLPGALDATLLGTAAAVALLALPWLLLHGADHTAADRHPTGPAQPDIPQPGGTTVAGNAETGDRQ